jgi:predicted acyl esterase
MYRFRPLPSLSLFVFVWSAAAAAKDPVVERMYALFSQSDADRNGALSAAEQTRAVDGVKRAYGDEWSWRIGRMFARAAAPDKSVGADAWRRQVDAFERPPVAETVMIPMRDGKLLATDLFKPAGSGPFPVILSRTPYDRTKHGAGGVSFVRDGFVFASQDMRGRFASQGENLPFVGCGWGEHQDGADTLAWLRKQPWCDGRIGTIGGSAGGITQNLLAGAAPEGLKAQHIAVAAANLYLDASYIGGAFRKADVENWLTGNHFDPQALEIMRAHPCYDGYWRTLDTTQKFSQMTAPAIHVGGWFDMFAQATIDEFAGRQHDGGPGARGAQKLIMGPWTHGIGQMPVGELQFPGAARAPARYDAGRWFAHYLCGEANGVESEPAVAYYVMGDANEPGAPGNEWRFADDWPVPSTESAAYLTRAGGFTLVKPEGAEEAFREYTFDPADPCPTVGGNNLTIQRGPMDQSRIESRPDVLTFTSEPLREPVEVTGRVKAALFVSSTAADTDLSVRLCDVYPDGRSYLIAEGMLRLRHRRSLEKPEPLAPGKVEEVTVDCWSTSIVFNKGHRLRATVTSSNYPRFDVNPGTGAAWSEACEKVRQVNRIYCDVAHPSRLLLPLVRRP